MTMVQKTQALELEDYLGDPFDSRNVFSFRTAVEMDELEAYPEAACDMLNDWGLPAYYVPAKLGGKFTSFEQVLNLMRVVARRDLTAAIAHGKTYLGAVAVWMAASVEQQSKLARIILDRGQVSLGLTEQGHGSDLMASDVEVRHEGEKYRLYGRKWLINNATRSRALTVFTRTDPQGGPRGFSLLLVDKAEIDRRQYSLVPKIKTHGIRGADISGIQFSGCSISPDAFIGKIGSGLDITLKALQVTRTMCSALSLGAADTALRITLDFAQQRRIYNNTVVDIPYPRQLLLESFLDLLVCDCTAVGGARALHVAPEQMSVWSAVVKNFVPVTVETLIQQLSRVLGARFYLREDHCAGMFQKIVRDNAIVSLFDGSTAVNLEMIALQLRRRLRENPDTNTRETPEDKLSTIFNIAEPLPEFIYEAFDLSCPGADPVFSTLSRINNQLEAFWAAAPDGVANALKSLVTELQGAVSALRTEVEAAWKSNALGTRPSARLFRLAQRYSTLHAAASCLHLWTRSREHLDPFFSDGIWLILALRRLLGSSAIVTDDATVAKWEGQVFDELLKLHRDNRLFAVTTLALSPRELVGKVSIQQ